MGNICSPFTFFIIIEHPINHGRSTDTRNLFCLQHYNNSLNKGTIMRTDISQTIYRHDYQPFPFALSQTKLEFDLDADKTRVKSELQFQPKEKTAKSLVLYGEELELLSLQINGRELNQDEYHVDEQALHINSKDTEQAFTLTVINNCSPVQNTALMGLYVSGDKLFTQCEAQGFRRITWFPDRPDVMSIYDVVLRADPNKYPILLSNGNLIEQKTLDDGRQQTLWQDPHPKPSYLFALVAGDFDCIERHETTKSGKDVLLQVYSDKGCADQTHWALDCLARSLHWDESRFNLELDLDRFMVVAVRDFNMGAMENKGLNIFNSAYVLADPNTATDAAYRGVEAVIGHEYFHNWTGNRVTCRDWFQLSLKEGLTVFREHEFCADMLAHGLPEKEAQSARAVKRIDDVHTLRLAQFPEDAGPMAHPIRPDSYQEIGNFYTATIYEKGAEVIRMQHTLLGEQGFQDGVKEYFHRHDGQAVTCDDFVSAMESVYSQQNPGKEFNIFRRWYEQAGTPKLTLNTNYDAAKQEYTITIKQNNPAVGIEPKDKVKPPLHIPVAIGLLSQTGHPLGINYAGKTQETVLLELKDSSQTWTFNDIPEQPVLSILRGFSAPVIIENKRSFSDLSILAKNDPDPFARWDATQNAALDYLSNTDQDKPITTLLDIWQSAINDNSLSPAYKARLLSLPALRELINRNEPMDPQKCVRAWDYAKSKLGSELAGQWQQIYNDMHIDDAKYSPDPVSAGKRELRNLALSYLLAAEIPGAIDLAHKQYNQATNMTESIGALNALLRYSPTNSQDLLDQFHSKWQDNQLVLDRWFGIQASAPSYDVAKIKQLMDLPDFSIKNPNRARSVIFRFCLDNPKNLHTQAGYDFWAEQVLTIDKFNPEIAARLARGFDNWSKYADGPRNGMLKALEQVYQADNLSRNVNEIISKALGKI